MTPQSSTEGKRCRGSGNRRIQSWRTCTGSMPGNSRGAGRYRGGSWPGRMKILVDGGLRSGVDVFKALAMGADGVLLGRPFVTAVYGGAAEGVQCYIDKIGGELEDTMRMCGANTISDITRDMIFRA